MTHGRSRPNWSRDWHTRPLVLGPASIPCVTDVDQALGEPGAALLSAVVHAQSAHAVLAARAGLFAGTTFAADAEPYYTDLIFGLLSTADQSQLEAAMQQLEPRLPIPMTVPNGYKPWDFVRESAVAEGKAQGKAQGEAQARERLRQALRNGQGTTRSLWCCKERRVGCEAASLRPTKQARTVQAILGKFLRNGQGTTRSLWCCKERRVGCQAAGLRPT